MRPGIKRRNNNGQPGLLHPQGDQVTWQTTIPPMLGDVGYRYVMGERAGWGHDDDDIDEFAGIGTHVHEIGHLLGLNHGKGGWVGENPHTSTVAPHARPHTNATGANFVGWGVMQSAAAGPELSSNGYHQGYGSCPQPVNPFYRMDLGWIDPVAITEGQQDYSLVLGSVHRIAANKSQSLTRAHRDTVLLERRSHHDFGHYVSFYKGDQDPGLLIWRRDLSEQPILIVADERRIVDARDRDRHPLVPEYQDRLSDPFPVPTGLYSTYAQPAVEAVYAHTDSVGLRQTTDWEDDPGNLGFALTDIHLSDFACQSRNSRSSSLDVVQPV